MSATVAARRTRLGMLTPSSNTTLEPLTARILAGVPGASAHFARFPVTEIALDARNLAQFDDDARLPAADLLAEARCDVIAWSGTSAGWLGFEHDERLCAAIEARTGARATSAVLANNDLFRRHRVRRFGLVTPYTSDVQERIVANFERAGFACAAERHLGIRDNFAFAAVDADTITTMVRDVAAAGPDGICVLCTNVAGAALAEALEAETGITLYDSVAVTVLRSLEIAGVDASPLRGWGRIFAA